MSPAELPGTVHDSKIKRQERLKSRFRDRGGIFVPSEGNALVDVLLSRGVNGESPVKKRAPRKSAVTPKPRAPAASKAAAKTKTPRTGTSKRSTRKSATTPNGNGGKENSAPVTKKRRGALKTPKLQKCRTDDDMDTTYAGPSRPPAAAQRRPFADQLADAINATRKSTAPDSISTLAIPRPAVISTPGAPPPLGKSKKTRGERSAKRAVDLPPHYTEGLEAVDEAPVHDVKAISSPLVLALERQQRQKQDAQRRTATKPLPHEQAVEPEALRRPPLATKQTVPPVQRELEESDSDDSDVPLAKKHAERSRLPSDAPTKPSKGKDDEPLPPKKRRGAKTKALPAGDDASDKASSRTKAQPAAQAPPPTKSARVRVDPGGAGKVRVLQENGAPTNARRKRERTRTMIDGTKGEKEHQHEPPRKRSRRAGPVVNRRRKEDEGITRSAREASRVMMDRPLPSPVKQPAAHRKPASKGKLPSRTGAAQALRSRGLPLAVLRRIKINAQALPALDDIDDDDPIDFLRT